jgi:hypothetical protein
LEQFPKKIKKCKPESVAKEAYATRLKKAASVKLSITSWLVLGSVFFFILLALLPNHPKCMALLGWTMLAPVCFIVLNRSYQKKTPMFTRGGWLRHEKQPRPYSAMYLSLSFVGVFVVVTFILLWAFY